MPSFCDYIRYNSWLLVCEFDAYIPLKLKERHKLQHYLHCNTFLFSECIYVNKNWEKKTFTKNKTQFYITVFWVVGLDASSIQFLLKTVEICGLFMQRCIYTFCDRYNKCETKKLQSKGKSQPKTKIYCSLKKMFRIGAYLRWTHYRYNTNRSSWVSQFWLCMFWPWVSFWFLPRLGNVLKILCLVSECIL